MEPPIQRNRSADAEAVEQHRLGADHVPDGHQGEVEPVGACPVAGIDGGRAGGAHARADDVGADDEVAVGVDGLARPHQGLPPAALARDRMGMGEVLVTGQRVADQDGVGAVRVEGAGRPVGDLERGQLRRRHPSPGARPGRTAATRASSARGPATASRPGCRPARAASSSDVPGFERRYPATWSSGNGFASQAARFASAEMRRNGRLPYAIDVSRRSIPIGARRSRVGLSVVCAPSRVNERGHAPRRSQPVHWPFGASRIVDTIGRLPHDGGTRPRRFPSTPSPTGSLAGPSTSPACASPRDPRRPSRTSPTCAPRSTGSTPRCMTC